MSHVGDGRAVGLDVTRWACSEPMRIAFRSLVSFTLMWAVSLLAGEPATYTNAVGDKRQSPRSITWSNPLPFEYAEGQTEPCREVRDPCIIQDAGSYYLVFTMRPFANREEKRMDLPNNGSSPGIALYRSGDLRSWKFEGWLVKSAALPENCPYKHRFWAPEIHKMGGKFYLIFTADNWLKKEYNPAGTWGTAGYAFVGVAEKITGPYEHITYIPGAACDTSLFADADGRTYAIIPRYNIDIQEIDLTGLSRGDVKLLGLPKRVVTAENSDIGIEAKPDYLEGPRIEKIGTHYYLFCAEIFRDKKYPDWLGYHTGVAVADKVMGPYQKDPRGRIFEGGHLSVFEAAQGGKWFSYRGEASGPAHGLLCVDRFELDADNKVRTSAPTLGPQAGPD
jgi:xylan 1,4-beta-xylosidase